MSSINPPSISFDTFINDIYSHNKRIIIFWDTCALLEIYRFTYRNGDLNSYHIIKKIEDLISNDHIYSLASALTITEWNEHEENVKTEILKSLEHTSKFHKVNLDVINEINNTTLISESLDDKDLLENLEQITDNILSKTIFIDTTDIANNALIRVSEKKPPALKKNEFKDCSVWETILFLSRKIKEIDNENIQIFYTVNTDDFVDKSREPKVFHGLLLSEAALSNLACCINLSEVDSKL